jgi:hypothetical protein
MDIEPFPSSSGVVLPLWLTSLAAAAAEASLSLKLSPLMLDADGDGPVIVATSVAASGSVDLSLLGLTASAIVLLVILLYFFDVMVDVIGCYGVGPDGCHCQSVYSCILVHNIACGSVNCGKKYSQ